MSAPTPNPTRWFTEEIQPHEPALRSYLRGSFPAVRDVDDVVQESYLRIWKACTTQSVTSAKAFLFTVARRIALNVVRKNHYAPFVALGDFAASRVLEDKPDACDQLIVHERINLVADALLSLSPRCREVVILHKVKGIPQRKVAAQLGLSERTVESHVRTGVARCTAYIASRTDSVSHRHEA